jgi:glycerol-3-phosphate dehydrogenase
MNTVRDDARTYDAVIIGAGVVGCAIARELAQFDLEVVVIEQSGDVCEGTSKANTAILHTGFDCVPGSLESRLVRRGYQLLCAYADAANIAVERTKGLLVAWDDEQVVELPKLQQKARDNGYQSTQLLSIDSVRQREPNLGDGVQGGLDVPGESIICPWSPVLAFATEAASVGTEFRFHSEVTGVTRSNDTHILTTATGLVRARWLFNAAGLSSGVVDGLCDHHNFHVTPRRGELLVFDKLARGLISSIILPVPTPTTKGILVAPTVYGNLVLGPTADNIDDPAATASTAGGIARLLNAGQRIVPKIVEEEVTAIYAGLRAATEFQDYQIRSHGDEHYVCVGGIRSTGLTASLAIGEYVVSLAADAGLVLTRRDVTPTIPTMAPLGESQLRRYQDASAISRDSSYGDIVCHCERVTRGEIRDACDAVLPASGIGGLRRRTRAMNGRCQGFYCAAEVVAMLASLTNREPSTLTGL